VTDPIEGKRNLAKRFGANKVFDSTAADLQEQIHENTGGRGVEYLIEASGVGRALASIPGLIRKQATVLLYGHGHAGTDLSVLNSIMFREPRLVTPVGASGGFEHDGRPSTYARALNLIEQHEIDVASIITHRYTSLAAVQDALERDIHTRDYVKGVVVL